MSIIAPPVLGGVLPAGNHFMAAGLAKYREMLRRLRASSAGGEEPAGLFHQAKARVLARVKQRRDRARVDPARAFLRARERLAEARLGLRELREQQRQRLRDYCAASLGRAAPPSVAARLARPAAAPAAGAPGAQQVREEADEGAALARVCGASGPLRALVVGSVGAACKAFLAAGASLEVVGAERMAAALGRPPGQGLVTVSNHVGAVDDPLVTSALVPAAYLARPSALRWTLCATDRCFKSAAAAAFFRAGKVLPVERGGGVSQFGMRAALSRLHAGDWVHLFPEGTRGRGRRMGPARRGVGWLVAGCAVPPLVLPFVHGGMEEVLPRGAAAPRLGRRLRVLVGEPVAVADLVEAAARQGWPQPELHRAIAERVGQELYRLKAELEGLPLEEVAPEPAAVASAASEDWLLPLIEDEMDAISHSWTDRPRHGRLRARLAAHAAALLEGCLPGTAPPLEPLPPPPPPSELAQPDAARRLRLLRGHGRPWAPAVREPQAGVRAWPASVWKAGGVPDVLAVASEYATSRVRHMQQLLA